MPLQRIVAITLVVVCGILAVFLYRGAHRSNLPGAGPSLLAHTISSSNSGSARTEGAGTSASGTSGSAAASTGAPAQAVAAIPETIPDVRMPDVKGTERSLREYLGHPLIINFWATWCPPCRREMPLLQQLWTKHQHDGLRVVGIAVDSRDAVNNYLRHTTVGYPLLVGEQQGETAATQFGVEPVLPFSVFADGQGHIVAVKVGELHQAEAEYIIAAIQQVTQGRETLPQARVAIASELRRLEGANGGG